MNILKFCFKMCFLEKPKESSKYFVVFFSFVWYDLLTFRENKKSSLMKFFMYFMYKNNPSLKKKKMSIFIFVFQWHISFRVIQTSYFVEIFFDVLKLNIENYHCWKEENEIAFLCWSSAKTRVESSRQEIRAGDFEP